MLVNEQSRSLPESSNNTPRLKPTEQTASPLDALSAFNAVAALAAAQQQGQNSSMFPNNELGSNSKNLMQLMSTVSPSSSANIYQRNYLEAFRFYKAAYGTAANSTNSH